MPSLHHVERYVGSAADDAVFVPAAKDADVVDRVYRFDQKRAILGRIVGRERYRRRPWLTYQVPSAQGACGHRP